MIQKIRNLDPVYHVLYCIFIVFLYSMYIVFLFPVFTPLLMLIEMLVARPQAFNCAADTVGGALSFTWCTLS